MVANLAQHAIGADDNEVTLLDDAGLHKLPRAPKTLVARQIVAHIAALCRTTQETKILNRKGRKGNAKPPHPAL